MNRYTLHIFAGLAGALLLFSACGRSPQSSGVEYASQMYHSRPLEPYSQSEYNQFFPNDFKNAREPVPGTVARGKLAYYFPYANTEEEYQRAGAELTNPIPLTQANLDEGKRIYNIYCQHCHGKDGKGDGPVTKSPNYPPVPPAYTSDRVKNLKDGNIFFSVFHGKGMMGAHGSQVAPDDIWRIVHYVKKMRGDKLQIEGAPAPAATDSTAAAPADTTKPQAQPAPANH